MSEEQPRAIAVPLVWVGVEDIAVLFSNAFFCQFDQDLQSFILTLGQVTPPPLVGTPQEVAEQAANIEFVQVKPVARFSFSETRLKELIASLQANLDQLERARTMIPGDPR